MTDRKLPISPSEQATANHSPLLHQHQHHHQQHLHHQQQQQQQHPAHSNHHLQQQHLRRVAGEQQQHHGIATTAGIGETLAGGAGEGPVAGGGSGPVPTAAPAPPPRGTSSLSSGHHLQAGAAVVALASVNSSTGSIGNSLGGGGPVGSNHATGTTSTAVTSNSTKHANMHRLKHTSSLTTSIYPELYDKGNRLSHSSDTSQADTMTSVTSSSLDSDEVDLSGLVESVVDSDEEDIAESIDSLSVRDTVRECLEKDPSDRTVEDIEILLEFTQKLKAFTNMTFAVRRALCSVMVFAVVEKAGTVVMNDGEELDSWSVLINGHVEIEHSTGEVEYLHYGDSFGIMPTMDKLYHRGVMRTKCDDCQFVCITQTDYYRIQHQGEENIRKIEEDGQVVMVTELRNTTGENGSRKGYVVIRGTLERLMHQLVEDTTLTDPNYVEDFLLTFRTFINNPIDISKQLLKWFNVDSSGASEESAGGSSDLVDGAAASISHHFSSSPGDSVLCDRVTRVVLLWVNNHFTDFDTDPQMMEFLEIFESALMKKNMGEQRQMLHVYAQHNARERNVTLARSSRDEDLNFQISTGPGGIFITQVEPKTKAYEVGLKRGDQILEVNGQSFEHVTCTRALEILMGTTHLSITVKSNLWALKGMHSNADGDSGKMKLDLKKGLRVDLLQSQKSLDLVDKVGGLLPTPQFLMPLPVRDIEYGRKDSGVSTPSSSSQINNNKGGSFMTLGGKKRIQKALIKMNLLPKNSVFQDDNINNNNNSSSNNSSNSSSSANNGNSNNGSNYEGGSDRSSGISVNFSSQASSISTSSITTADSDETPPTSTYQSNPDLRENHCTPAKAQSTEAIIPTKTSSTYLEEQRVSDFPEHILKVYKSDQTCKYLLVHKETTAHEVVMLALQEFGIHDPSSNFSLCEVSVGEGGMIKQRRLPDQLQNLAERIGLSSRYYLKTNGITETLVPDDVAPELIRESAVHFLQLNANELAIQLTLQDFAIFRQIESTEYIDDLFNLKSRYGKPMLVRFAELVNREMFWVVTEVCSEHNMMRRCKIIKQFIKIARHCKECKNFNSLFAIISGLGHAAVSRLRQTWEKLPSKYQKLFNDLQDLMDPSRNMSKYRQLIQTELNAQQPVIPFYPVVKKDLTFIHLGNDTKIESLINFEKLRMISKEIRTLLHMCNSPYDILTMLEYKCQPPSSAMLALNQMSVPSGSGNLMLVTHAPPPQTITSGASAFAHSQTVKRRKKSTAAPNPKKMFEEAQMVRRVKAYLNNMKVITDEDELHRLSLECEAQGGTTPNTVQVRKRYPSPTLSTTSSTSSTSEGKKGALGLGMSSLSIGSASSGNSGAPKFGAASPQAVKKLLSLSEQTKTRPHQPRHPAAGSILPPPLSTIHHHHHQHHHGAMSGHLNSTLSHFHHAHPPTNYLHHGTGITISPSQSPAHCCVGATGAGAGAGSVSTSAGVMGPPQYPPPSAHAAGGYTSGAGTTAGVHLAGMLPNPPNYSATMSMYANGRPVLASRILESSVDAPSQMPPPMELPPESSSFRSPPNYAQTAHRRIASSNSTTIPPPYPTPHQNFGNSSRIISAVGISPIAPNFVAPAVNALSPMYTGNSGGGGGGGGGTSVSSSGSVVGGGGGVCSNLPPAIPARLHETVVSSGLVDSVPPPLPPPSIDLSAESSSVSVLSSAASARTAVPYGVQYASQAYHNHISRTRGPRF
ncbi:rap guanine nucleotide exchange factor 2 isoform X2 [Anopheles funestus]|uniref:rap guanine nucleotide exchange factor 2 isoform X2 n=1 Tax=Anopheles funestus TaxID=62324 RepID=UPI0020C67B04|nr:rap guanine nucleotide exchange factor 2 isoform X2 [Anopheles funestus]